MQTKKINSQRMSEYRRYFYEAYHKRIIPILNNFEQLRRSEISKLHCFCAIFGVVGLLCGYYFFDRLFFAPLRGNYAAYDSGNPIFTVLSCLMFVCAIVFLCWYPSKCNKKFITQLKYSCMKPVCSVFEHLEWFPQKEIISDTDLSYSELFAYYNHRLNDDTFEGKYKGVDFKISETYLWYESGSGKNRTYRQIFKGVIVTFAANKVIRNKTMVATKGDYNIKRNSIGVYGTAMIALSQMRYSSLNDFLITAAVVMSIATVICIVLKLIKSKDEENMRLIKLEDPEFNKKYKAYSSDEVEGRYLITPAFMERFNNIQTAFGSKNAKCAFFDDKIMFAISTNKNLFELGDLYHSLEDPKQLETFFNELSSILSLVDYFKLDEKTGL